MLMGTSAFRQNIFYITVNRLLHYRFCHFCVVNFRYGGGFVLQFLVDSEEMLHFVKYVLGKVVYRLVSVVVGVGEGYCYHLFVH